MKRPLYLLTGLAAALMLLVSVVLAAAVPYTVIEEIPLEYDSKYYFEGLRSNADGRYFAYTLQDYSDTYTDKLFLYDRETGKKTNLSAPFSPIKNLFGPMITADGRFIAFSSTADYPNYDDISYGYIFDQKTGSYTQVMYGANGEALRGSAGLTDISTDGRYAVYTAMAYNPFDGKTILCTQPEGPPFPCWAVFLFDGRTKTTERISVSSSEALANDNASRIFVSDNGRYVLFNSYASNLDGGNVKCSEKFFCPQWYLRDRHTGTTQLVSINKEGEPSTGGFPFEGELSRDGRYAVFSSSDGDLVEGTTEGVLNLYLRDLVSQTTELISVSSSGTQSSYIEPQGWPYNFAGMSPDARYILFTSRDHRAMTDDPEACDPHQPDSSCAEALFLRDRLNGTTTLVSRDGDTILGANALTVGGIGTSVDQILLETSRYGEWTPFVAVVAPENTTLNRPQSVKASSGLNGSVHLSWTNTNTTSVASEIDRSPDGLTGWVNVGAAPVGMTTFTDTTAPCKKSYYRVRAVDPVNNLVSPYSFTIKGKNDCRELLQNGGFEQPGETGKQAAFWNGKNLDDDLRVRNKNGIVVSYSGDAAFEFNGTPGVNSSISQTAAIPAGTGYNTLELSAWVMGENPTGVRIRATVYLDDGSAQKLTLDTSAITPEYTHLSTTLPYAASMQYAKVQIRQKDGTGKFRVDEISLRLQTASAPLLPLP